MHTRKERFVIKIVDCLDLAGHLNILGITNPATVLGLLTPQLFSTAVWRPLSLTLLMALLSDLEGKI